MVLPPKSPEPPFPPAPALPPLPPSAVAAAARRRRWWYCHRSRRSRRFHRRRRCRRCRPAAWQPTNFPPTTHWPTCSPCHAAPARRDDVEGLGRRRGNRRTSRPPRTGRRVRHAMPHPRAGMTSRAGAALAAATGQPRLSLGAFVKRVSNPVAGHTVWTDRAQRWLRPPASRDLVWARSSSGFPILLRGTRFGQRALRGTGVVTRTWPSSNGPAVGRVSRTPKTRVRANALYGGRAWSPGHGPHQTARPSGVFLARPKPVFAA